MNTLEMTLGICLMALGCVMIGCSVFAKIHSTPKESPMRFKVAVSSDNTWKNQIYKIYIKRRFGWRRVKSTYSYRDVKFTITEISAAYRDVEDMNKLIQNK